MCFGHDNGWAGVGLCVFQSNCSVFSSFLTFSAQMSAHISQAAGGHHVCFGTRTGDSWFLQDRQGYLPAELNSYWRIKIQTHTLLVLEFSLDLLMIRNIQKSISDWCCMGPTLSLVYSMLAENKPQPENPAPSFRSTRLRKRHAPTTRHTMSLLSVFHL